MSDEKFEASARRFTRITRRGLIEENAATGEVRRISQQPEDMQLGKSGKRKQLRIRRKNTLKFKKASRIAVRASHPRLRYTRDDNTTSGHTQSALKLEQPSKLRMESARKLLRFERPASKTSKESVTEAPNKVYQQKYRRMRLKQGTVSAIAVTSPSRNTLLHDDTEQRLRFERPAPAMPKAPATEAPRKVYQQKYRRMRLKQGRVSAIAVTSPSRNTLLHHDTEQRLRFERPAPAMPKAPATEAPNKAYQQKYRRMRLKQGALSAIAEASREGNTLLHHDTKQQLRFERPAPAMPKAPATEAPNKAYQQKYRRMRLKQGTVSAITATPPSGNTLLHHDTQQRLRFERPAPAMPKASATEAPNKAYQHKYRRMRLKQGTVNAIAVTPPSGNMLLHHDTQQRLRFERPAPAAESPHKVYQQKYRRMRLKQGNVSAIAVTPPTGNTLLRSDTRQPLAFKYTDKSSETSLNIKKFQPRHSHYNTKIFAAYVITEQNGSGRLLNNGERRHSRLKFEKPSGSKLKFNKRGPKTAASGGPPPIPPGGEGFGPLAGQAVGKKRKGFFGGQSVLSKEVDKQLDKLSQNSDNEGVQAANQHRKWVSYGAREGNRAGKRWLNGEDKRIAKREKKKQVRANREKIYQQKHGKPSMSAKGRNWFTQRKFQVKRFAEKRLGAKNAQRAEKLLSFAARKVLQVIRLVITAIGGPILGIVAVYIGMAAIILMMFGAFFNNAVVVLSSYSADNVAVEAASSYYTKLEAELDKEIKNISTAWEWQHIDQFHYDLDDIGHDPFQLMGYLSVKYPGFTFSDVKTELDYIFDQRYTFTTHQWYEWRGQSPHRYKYYHLDVTLRAKPMEPILLQELAKDTANDLVSWYGVLMETKGAHQAYANPFDIDWSGNVSSLYGYRVDPIGEKELQQHRGLDIAMPTGTPIRAGLSGTVRYVGHDNIMGNYIILDADGVEHTMKYGHCDEVRVSVGEKVVAGETVIGTVGNSGQSTGPHLHLEILENGEYVNPIYSLNYKEKTS